MGGAEDVKEDNNDDKVTRRQTNMQTYTNYPKRKTNKLDTQIL